MSTDETADESGTLGQGSEAEVRELLGLFDVPAFARRGADLEHALKHLRLRLRRERAAKLDMVRLRLKQWAALATGPDDWSDTLRAPVAPLWDLTEAEAPTWARVPAPPRKRRAAASDLRASVRRFNARWAEFFEGLPLDGLNARIEQYNRYYVLEKECVLGSARLAARHFQPVAPLTRAGLLAEFPPLPEPEPA